MADKKIKTDSSQTEFDCAIDPRLRIRISRSALNAAFYKAIKESPVTGSSMTHTAWRIDVKFLHTPELFFSDHDAFTRLPLDLIITPKRLSGTLKLSARLVLKLKTHFSPGSGQAYNTQTEYKGFRWIEKPTLELLKVKFTIDSVARRFIDGKKAEFTEAVDSMLQGSELGAHIQLLIEAALIGKTPELYGLNLWYRFTPDSLNVGPMSYNRKFVTGIFAVPGRLKVTETRLDPENLKGSFPNFQLPVQLGEDGQMKVSGRLSFKHITHILKAFFEDRVFTLKGRELSISDPVCSFSDGALKIDMRIDGRIGGQLVLSCLPHLDDQNNEVSLQNLVIDFKADTLVVGVLVGIFKKLIREKLTMLTHMSVDALRQLLQNNIRTNLQRINNSDSVSQFITLTSLIIQKLKATEYGLEIDAGLGFRYRIHIEKLGFPGTGFSA